ncbi:unnamed protein product [Dibothriocephalus latus]|uniref:Uncharacterized protein n=1 Tax=Dibothriocephalus latus TaxID=60516 RepID=A0A3P7QQL0_DIBLA|nr:unnamed protein product [Dibothriocephalus latus]
MNPYNLIKGFLSPRGFIYELNAAWKYTIDQGMGAFAMEAEDAERASPLIVSDSVSMNPNEVDATPHSMWTEASLLLVASFNEGRNSSLQGYVNRLVPNMYSAPCQPEKNRGLPQLLSLKTIVASVKEPRPEYVIPWLISQLLAMQENMALSPVEENLPSSIPLCFRLRMWTRENLDLLKP